MKHDAFDKLKASVIDAGLCHRCGTCVGACPKGALRLDDEAEGARPERIGECEDCEGECRLGCSGRYVDVPGLSEALFGEAPDNQLLGFHRGRFVAHATDGRVRREGASGGILTAALKHLFETGRIEGAQVMGMDPDRPWQPKPLLAHNYEEAQAASQSKYVVCPHNTLLSEIPPEGGPLAYVGLPCQVQALRKLQQAGHPVARRFRYVLGSYCGNILEPASTRAFLAKQGVHDMTEVRSLAFRAGEWPGNMRVELNEGRVIEMPKFHANYLIPFYIMRRCLLCTDLTNELTDLSGGDAWAPVYEERGKGFSMLITRTAVGEQLVEEMREAGAFELVPVSYEDAVDMHSHGLDLKKRGAFYRIDRRRRAGGACPEYGFELPREAAEQRKRMEQVMGAIFTLAWTPLGRRAIRMVPDAVIGAAFLRARTRWKSATRATKKSGLASETFRVDRPGGVAATDRHELGIDPRAPLYAEDRADA